MIRLALALVASLALAVTVRAADLPAGTWAANIDGDKGELVIKDVKDGKVAGTLLGTDFTGSWREKTLTFDLGGKHYEAHLVAEPGEKGQTKYTLTGTREENVRVPERVAFHKVKTGWYAQLSAETPVPTGAIKAEVRGVLVVAGASTYVSVKRKVGSETEETRVWVRAAAADEWKKLQQTLAPLNGKEVVATGSLAQSTSRARDEVMPYGALYFSGPFDIKPADAPK